MSTYPRDIQNLIDTFCKLPGIGPKTAARLVFFLLHPKRKPIITSFIQALNRIQERVVSCPSCLTYTSQTPCEICSDPRRDASLLCIVATPQELAAIEQTGQYQGRYHVLHGVLAPTEGITPDKLTIAQLKKKLADGTVREVIIALNPDLEGETTTLYLKKELEPFSVKITRLARGLPTGSDIEYADELTLRSAFEGRREI